MRTEWMIVKGITEMLNKLAADENVQFVGSLEEGFPVDGLAWYATLGGKNVKVEVTIVEGK